MSDALYRLNRVSRRLGDTFQLHIDELTIRRGETLTVLGPTGAGKTTLLRLLTGLESPDEGSVEFDGELLDGSMPLPLLRRLAMVHQRPILLNGSVASNVGYGVRLRGLPRDGKLAQVLDRLQLSKRAAQDARSLSGGQMQLVALARALVLEPEVLLLDEPTANLDPGHVGLIERAIAAAQAERGMTIVWATHNLFQARRVSQRVALLLDGHLVEIADSARFFDNQVDPRTAAFVQGDVIY